MRRKKEKRFLRTGMLMLIGLILVLGSCQANNPSPGIEEEPDMENTSIDHQQAIAFESEQGVLKTGTYRGSTIVYEEIDGKAVFDFDIVIDASKIQNSTIASTAQYTRLGPFSSGSRGAGRTLGTSLWPSRTIPYHIASSFTQRNRLEQAIAHVNAIGFNLIPRTTEADYIEFFYKDDDEGYWSEGVGKLGGKQQIHLNQDFSAGIAVHEILHALGIWHENSRSDRDDYLNINWNFIEDEKDHNFQTYVERGRDGFDYHNFDWMSIMLYHSYSFTTDNEIPTITKKGGVPSASGLYGTQMEGLSAGDIRTLQKMYPPQSYVHLEAVRNNNTNYSFISVNQNGDPEISRNTNRRWYYGTTKNNINQTHGITARKTIPGARISAVSRADNFIDLFMIGEDGAVYTAYYDPENRWGGWVKIRDLEGMPGHYVSAVARSGNHLDLFAITKDGRVMTAAWQHGIANSEWRGWWQIQRRRALCGTDPSAVSRTERSLDVFIIGENGNVYTSRWSADENNGNWGSWISLGSFGGPAATVTAIATGENAIEVIATRINGDVHTNSWNETGWSGWRRISGLKAQPGTPISGVASDYGGGRFLVTDKDQELYFLHRQDGFQDRNVYNSRHLGGQLTPGTATALVKTASNRLDVIGIGANGQQFYTLEWTGSIHAAWSNSWTLVEDEPAIIR